MNEMGKIQQAKPISREAALEFIESKKGLIADFNQRQEQIEKAQSVPLPGPTLKAFTSGAIPAGGKLIQKVVPARFAVLQALKSPLLAMMENAMSKKETAVEWTQSQQWECCYVFTEDAKIVFNDLKTKGVDYVREQAENAVMTDWEAASVNVAMLAIIEQIKRHIETTVKFAAEMESEGHVSFFREQPASP